MVEAELRSFVIDIKKCSGSFHRACGSVFPRRHTSRLTGRGSVRRPSGQTLGAINLVFEDKQTDFWMSFAMDQLKAKGRLHRTRVFFFRFL